MTKRRLFILVMLLLFVGVLSACEEEEDDNPYASEEALQNFDAAKVSMIGTPESSCFLAIGYDSEAKILVVRFRDSGKLYAYEHFSKKDWKEFKDVPSLGAYFNTLIKDKYSCYEIEEE